MIKCHNAEFLSQKKSLNWWCLICHWSTDDDDDDDNDGDDGDNEGYLDIVVVMSILYIKKCINEIILYKLK